MKFFVLALGAFLASFEANAAYNTAVNPQITDSVTQTINITNNNPAQVLTGNNAITHTNTQVLGDAPAQAMGQLFQSISTSDAP